MLARCALCRLNTEGEAKGDHVMLPFETEREYLEKLEKAAGIISGGRRFLLVAQMSKDADAVGSSCGLMLALR